MGLAAQLAMTRAYSVGAPTLTAMLQYSTIIFATIYGYFVWGDKLTWLSGLGLMLIVGSGAMAALIVREPQL
jgi:drug/metabolite transporter (DMT)-like permease